jgi:hypothetical protein
MSTDYHAQYRAHELTRRRAVRVESQLAQKVGMKKLLATGKRVA